MADNTQNIRNFENSRPARKVSTTINPDDVQFLQMAQAHLSEPKKYHRIEPVTRTSDYSQALSYEVYDPLWMLSRQWQMGRFKGNDCGSAVIVKVKAERTSIDHVEINEESTPFSADRPLEFDVEKRNVPLTPYVRIESAKHYLRMLQNSSSDKAALKKLQDSLLQSYPLDDFTKCVDADVEDLEELKLTENEGLRKLWAVYGRRMFDGVKAYEDFRRRSTSALQRQYVSWFEKKYNPLPAGSEGAWNGHKLGYDVNLYAGNRLSAEDYGSGRLSWYSFDKGPECGKKNTETKYLSYLPAPASFKAAPNRRLWEFEDNKVQFGNFANDDVSQLSSAVMMQYASMYGNDWLVVPLETSLGTIMSVDSIVVKDTFGQYVSIKRTPESDTENGESTFVDRWSLYTIAKEDAYVKGDFTTDPGLLFPPTVLRSEESAPLEEVQFLKDEMTNMIWGVENTIPDQCGGTLDGRSFSDKVLTVVDDQKGEPTSPEEDAEYSYLIQNRVPLNWIPFLPQRMKGEHREIIFRRGRMPIWYNGKYCSARPSTDLLSVKKSADGKVVPKYIYEEQVNGNGVKVVKTAQRTRWVMGQSYSWQGYAKKISGYQTNSGLMFDELLEIVRKENERNSKEE